MRLGSKTPWIVISGLASYMAVTLGPCAAPASALNRDGAVASARKGMSSATWTPDNGDGTFTNPLFYDEFSDPDLIRVGDYFYLTGTTMHTMPGLPILRSKDLVNWEFVAYAMDKLDLGPAFRLEGGQNIYGQGIWAPSFRYHDGKFYIFSNVNHQTTQMFTATDPKGPWTRTPMKRSFHDLSVLFDDDGKAYVVWGHQTMHLAQLTDDLTDIVPDTERVLFTADAGWARARISTRSTANITSSAPNMLAAFACRRRGRIMCWGPTRSIGRSACTRISAWRQVRA